MLLVVLVTVTLACQDSILLKAQPAKTARPELLRMVLATAPYALLEHLPLMPAAHHAPTVRPTRLHQAPDRQAVLRAQPTALLLQAARHAHVQPDTNGTLITLCALSAQLDTTRRPTDSAHSAQPEATLERDQHRALPAQPANIRQLDQEAALHAPLEAFQIQTSHPVPSALLDCMPFQGQIHAPNAQMGNTLRLALEAA
jgi:hypothetical protein